MCPIRPLDIREREEGEAKIVEVSGHISTFETGALGATFDGIIAAKRLLLVVDLSGVEIITSDGLGVLIRARKSVSEYGGRLLLCGVKGNVLSVFEMTRLDKVFSMHETVEAALAAAK